MRGKQVWQKSTRYSDSFRSITAASDGLICVGIIYSGNFITDGVISKFSFSGDLMWRKTFGGAGVDRFDGVAALSSGFVAVGYSWPDSFGNGDWTGVEAKSQSGSDTIVVKFSDAGDVEWADNFPGPDFFKGLNSLLWIVVVIIVAVLCVLFVALYLTGNLSRSASKKKAG